MHTPCYFVHLSDTHLVADPQLEQRGVNPYMHLWRAFTQIRHLTPPPACVIITGDLINDDNPQSYGHLKALTSQLSMPVYYALGNHDLRQPFRRILLNEDPPSAAPYYYTFRVGGYRGIVLDSLVAGEVGGAIDPTQLAWLAQTLAEEPTRPTLVFVHHPPTLTGLPQFDQHVLANREAFLEVVATHGQVRRVFFGHVHMPMQLSVRGLLCTSVPSTCYQFRDLSVTPPDASGPPGYGVVTLNDDWVCSRIVYF